MNKRALQMAIIISWVVLAICFFIKIFGGNYFDIAASNETFIAVCNFIDSNMVTTILMSFVTYSLSVVLLNLAVLRQIKPTLKQFIIIMLSTIIVFAINASLQFMTTLVWVSFALDFITYLIVPAILSKKPIRAFVGVIFYLLFQVVSLFVKSISVIKAYEMNTLIALIYSLDVYIMLILYYLYGVYSKKK